MLVLLLVLLDAFPDNRLFKIGFVNNVLPFDDVSTDCEVEIEEEEVVQEDVIKPNNILLLLLLLLFVFDDLETERCRGSVGTGPSRMNCLRLPGQTIATQATASAIKILSKLVDSEIEL